MAHVEYELEGFPYISIVDGEYVSPVSILKLCEEATAFGAKFLHDEYEKQREEPPMLLLGWQQVEMTQHFQDLFGTLHTRAPLVSGVAKFLRRRLQVFHVFDQLGNASLGYRTIIIDKQVAKQLICCVGKMIAVDLATHRVKPHPDFIKEALGSGDEFIKADRTIPDRCTQKVNIPPQAKVYRKRHQVTALEIGRNGHTNQSAYCAMCFNCLAAAISENFCEGFKPPVWHYLLRRVSILYLEGSAMGDNLDVIMWHNKSNLSAFCFHIMKGNALIGQAAFEFFPPEDSFLSKL